jgi:opacity protein-like surface antigen
MKRAFVTWTFVLLGAAVAPVRAADDAGIERMATCQDSWFDWNKSDQAQLKKFGDRFRADFSRNGNDPFFVPRKDETIAGLRVKQAFPDSVGMGVGFSVTVEATFDKARRTFEKVLGKKLQKCETSDNMRTCELDIAEKRSFTLMAEDSPKSTTTLVGCYYYYEK